MPKKLIKPKKFKDSDDDGLSDFDEINIFGSDPYNADSNGDGIEDGETVLNGRDPVTGSKLKDFFIPHSGNNYRPKSLHPKRLLFHAAAALTIKAVVVIFVVSYPLLAWMTPDISAIEGKKIIALTNSLRAGLSLAPLKENFLLDQAATKKVEDMFINQYFAHVSPKGFDLEHWLALAGYKNYLVVGENLAMGFNNANDVVEAWEKSPTHYANLIDENFTEIGVGMAGGNFSQVDTIFVAQYFSLSSDNQVSIEKAVNPVMDLKKQSDLVSTSSREKAVLSEKTTITPEKNKEIALIQKKTELAIDQPSGQGQTKVIKIATTLPKEVKIASVQVLNNNIPLSPVQSDATLMAVGNSTSSTEKSWEGSAVVVSDDSNHSIVVPTLSMTNASGEETKIEIPSQNIKPQQTSLADNYWFFKTHQNPALAQIFDISSIYFKIILSLAILFLLLNVFIQIKKQHPKVIFSSLGLIVFLIFLIIF